ncbi:hypothetical protein C0J50_11225 [Silurus asotus]|uniref:Uncharacterized protein n=1 Tax=Silurus asotus TaxID=30991 RepID=A0AAD5ADB1_SILAS|nr:hypothetical protein C0J50_11225 [Silurus asotus]
MGDASKVIKYYVDAIIPNNFMGRQLNPDRTVKVISVRVIQKRQSPDTCKYLLKGNAVTEPHCERVCERVC